MAELTLNTPSVSPFAEKVMLKMLFEQNGFAKHLRKNGWKRDDIGYALGVMADWVDNPSEENNLSTKRVLKARFHQIQHQLPNTPTRWQQAERNINILAELLLLNQAEIIVLRLAVYTCAEPLLKQFLSDFDTDLNQLCHTLVDLFGLNLSEFKLAFSSQGKLMSYGLIESNRNYYGTDDMADYLKLGDLLNIDEFCNFELSKMTLLKSCVNQTNAPTLSLDDFEHIHEMRDILLNYLQLALQQAKKGVNILIYGKPGTGKTEFSLLLAQAAQADSYFLSCEDHQDRETISPKKRLEYCRLAQTLLATQKATVIFDEIEDVFRSGLFSRSVAQEHKAWVNQLLETNQAPMIWLSNDVRGIDEAYLRRFDFVFEMPNLPLIKREALIRQVIGEQLPSAYVRHFAKNGDISPALLTRGLSLNQQLGQDLPPAHFAKRVLNWFNQTLQAQGYKKMDKISEFQASYRLDWVNCPENLPKITEGLKRTKRGRVCCYGPAGTGKTAWANWLAEELDMPVLQCRGSDLQDKYVGETEKRIAAAFRQASENKMVLILDEVDSFLFRRNGSERSWERGMVNEMLTQIEAFEGLLVVSTNLMEVLDPAVLRRFDLKMKFDFLRQEQICEIAKAQASSLNIHLTELDFMDLEKIKFLTLGDFIALARRHHFAPFDSGEEWIQALANESKLKGLEKSKIIGFC